MGAALTAAALAIDADPESFKTLVPKSVVQHWAGLHGAAIERYDGLMDELTPLESPGLPMLTVALGELRELARCPSALPAAAPLPPTLTPAAHGRGPKSPSGTAETVSKLIL